MKSELRLFGAAVVLLVIAYAFRPWAYDLWNPDEPRRAQVAREMLRSGDLLILTHNGDAYYDKPPLWFWTVALFSWIGGGVTETTARLPSILAALGLFALMALFLRGRCLRPGTPILAASILLTSPMLLIHPYLGRAANMDALLCLFTTASIFAFWGSLERDAWSWTAVAGALCGLAILTKGPPGLLVPLIGFGAAAWALPRRRGIRRLLAAVGIGLAVTALWYVPAALRGGQDFVDATLMGHIVKRVADPRSHQRPWFYFLKTLPMHFFPWVLLLPTALWAMRRRAHRPLMAASVVVAVLTVILFSLSRSKREIYLLPMFPFAAIVVAGLLTGEVPLKPALARWGRNLPLGLAVASVAVVAIALGLLAAGAFPIRSGDLSTAELSVLQDGLRAPLALTAAVLLAPVAISLVWALCRAAPAAAHAMALCAFLTLSAIPVHQRLFAALNPTLSARRLARVIRGEARDEDRLVQYRLEQNGLIFYADRFMEIHRSRDTDLAKVFTGDRPILCVTTREGYHRIHEHTGPDGLKPLTRGAIGSKRDLIIFRWTP